MRVCVHLCVFGHLYALWCISRLESGSRVLSSHELGLIFCLITPQQARGGPADLHATDLMPCLHLQYRYVVLQNILFL